VPDGTHFNDIAAGPPDIVSDDVLTHLTKAAAQVHAGLIVTSDASPPCARLAGGSPRAQLDGSNSVRGPGRSKGGNGIHVANAGAIFNQLEAELQATRILIAR